MQNTVHLHALSVNSHLLRCVLKHRDRNKDYQKCQLLMILNFNVTFSNTYLPTNEIFKFMHSWRPCSIVRFPSFLPAQWVLNFKAFYMSPLCSSHFQLMKNLWITLSKYCFEKALISLKTCLTKNSRKFIYYCSRSTIRHTQFQRDYRNNSI